MLDMFRRPTDPKEYNYLYGIPGLTAIGGLLAAHSAGVPNIYQCGYLFSSLCCVGGIAGLSAQRTARVGNALGMTGVAGGVVTAIASLNMPAPLLTQAVGLLGTFGAGGYYLGSRVAVTELPQTVAAFHALVGVAATATSIGSFMAHPNPDGLHRVACYLGSGIGAITVTGSCAAFLKLSGLMRKGYDLPFKNVLNRPLFACNAAGLAALLTSPSHAVGLAAVCGTAAASATLGWNITNSIGSADMPVAITVLNSYSGWALCAEGFMLNNPMLTIVGSLIGSSGAILSKIMCDAMNRRIDNVIFGSYAELEGEMAEITGTHTETNVNEVVDGLVNAKDVIVVPGYGLAVARA